MAIRSIGAKALQQNKIDWADEAETTSVTKQSLGPASAVSGVISSGTDPNSAIRNLRRWVTAGCLGLIAVGSTGCTMTAGLGRSFSQSECIDDFMIGYRNRAMAEKAWHCRKDRFCNQCNAREFKDGFMKGYAEVAEGGNGCTPAIAPSQYLGWRYQSSGGQGAVNAWFQGFPEGARAAEEDGVGNWRRTQYVGSAAPGATMATPGTLNGPIGVGVPVPGMIAPPPANPFYSDQELIPAPMNSIGNPDSVQNDRSTEFPFAEVITDSKGSAVQPKAETAMKRPAATNNDVNVDNLFGGSATPVSDSGSEGLPFSFE